MNTLQITPPFSIKGLGITMPRSVRRRDEAAGLSGLHLLIVADSGEYLLADTVVRRGDGIAPQRLYTAGLSALGHARRLGGVLAARGFDDAWARGFEGNLIAFQAIVREEQSQQYKAEVAALVSTDATSQLAALVRSVLMVATPAGGRVFFDSQVNDLATPQGVLTAAHELVIKGSLPAVKGRLADFGVSDAMLGQVKVLLDQADKEFRERLIADASSERMPTALRVVRGLILQELGTLSATARTDLGEDLAAPLQMNNLLDLAARREAPEPPLVTPTPPPVAPTPPVVTPAPPAAHAGAASTPAAGSAAPGGAATPPVAAAAATPAAGAGAVTASPAAPPGTLVGLRPGQVLDTRRAAQGLEVLIVQDNQSAQWVAIPDPAAAPAAPAPAPGATATPQGAAPHAAASAAASRGRRQRRGSGKASVQ